MKYSIPLKKPDSDWVEPIDISNTSNNSYEPSMDIDPFDNLHVVWQYGEKEWLDRPVYDAIWINREIYLQILSQ